MLITKQEKLEHYAKCELVEFIQFDAFDVSDGMDSVMQPDQDGDWVSLGETQELMSGNWDVRVLITRERIDKAKTVRMLRKIIAWIEADDLKEYLRPRGTLKIIGANNDTTPF